MKEFTIFIDESKLNFSRYFKEELSNQLLEQFEYNLKIKNVLTEHFFALFIDASQIEINKNEDYAYMKISILSPDSISRPLTIGWKSKCCDEPLKIHSKLKENDKIQFFYFTDFPKDALKQYVTKKQKISKTIKTNFEYKINYEGFPDLVMKIGFFNELDSNEILKINEIVAEKIEKIFPTCLSSPLLNNSIAFDFQIDSSKFEQKDLKTIEKFFNEIVNQFSKSNFRKKIEYIIIE